MVAPRRKWAERRLQAGPLRTSQEHREQAVPTQRVACPQLVAPRRKWAERRLQAEALRTSQEHRERAVPTQRVACPQLVARPASESTRPSVWTATGVLGIAQRSLWRMVQPIAWWH